MNIFLCESGVRYDLYCPDVSLAGQSYGARYFHAIATDEYKSENDQAWRLFIQMEPDIDGATKIWLGSDDNEAYEFASEFFSISVETDNEY